MPMTYVQFRQGVTDAYRQSNASPWTLGMSNWGPLNSASSAANSDPQTLFNRIVNETVKATAAQTAPVDWSILYGMRKLLAHPALMTAVRNFQWETATRSAMDHGRRALVLARHIRAQFDLFGESHLLNFRGIYGVVSSIDPATLLSTVLVAVLGVICPPAAAFAAILEPVIAIIIKVVFEGLTKTYAMGNYGGMADGAQQFTGLLQQFATEAAAA
jgi:hypothetical protein